MFSEVNEEALPHTFAQEANDLMTDACLNLVKRVLQNLYSSVEKMPFGIRFMIRSLLESSMTKLGIQDETIFEKSAYLIADLLAGCWLNTAFRCSECFGMPLTLKEEANFTALFMNSSRLIFEHTLLVKPFPVKQNTVNGFNVSEINKFIAQQKPKILVYYQKLISIECKSITVEDRKFY